MDKPKPQQIGPYAVPVIAGQEYFWCSCGLSKQQPWCDGSHVGTGFEPLAFIALISEEFYMCGCKNSDNKPYCFGNCRGHHKRVREEARTKAARESGIA